MKKLCCSLVASVLVFGCSKPSGSVSSEEVEGFILLGEVRPTLATTIYDAKVQWITALLEQAPTIPPTTTEATDLFELVRRDPDFRIKVRAMAVLPFVQDRERAIDVLIESLKDRDLDSNGGGNVPLYATKYLSDMKAKRAIPAIEEWLKCLEEQQPYSQDARKLMLEKGRKHLANLKTDQPRAR